MRTIGVAGLAALSLALLTSGPAMNAAEIPQAASAATAIHRIQVRSTTSDVLRVSATASARGVKARARAQARVKVAVTTDGGTRVVTAGALGRGVEVRHDLTAATAAARREASKRSIAAARGKAVGLAGKTARATRAPKQPPTSPTVLGLNVWDQAAWNHAESTLGFKAGVVGVFADFVHNPDFPSAWAAQVAQRGATMLVSWEPWDSWTSKRDQSAFQLDDITRGDYDSLIKRWANQIRTFKHPVLIRFAPEMNGDWLPWSTGVNGNGAGDYVAAWRHVTALFDQVGATNARWVWNPISEPGGSVPLSSVYPGPDSVDWVALDGYNWGSTRSWGWQSYDDIFASSVKSLKTLAHGKPWMIAEVGSAPGPLKDEWIVDTLRRAHSDGARAVVWFELDKETDWRLSENAVTAAAARSVATATGWIIGGNLRQIESIW